MLAAPIGSKYFNDALSKEVEFQGQFFIKSWSTLGFFKQGNYIFSEFKGRVKQFLVNCESDRNYLSSHREEGHDLITEYEFFCAVVKRIDNLAKDFAARLKEYNTDSDAAVIKGNFAVMNFEDATRITSEMGKFSSHITYYFLSPGTLRTYLVDRINKLRGFLGKTNSF